MEYSATKTKAPFALLILSCLLLPLVSSVPLSRSVSLMNLHQGSAASALEAPVQIEAVVGLPHLLGHHLTHMHAQLAKPAAHSAAHTRGHSLTRPSHYQRLSQNQHKSTPLVREHPRSVLVAAEATQERGLGEVAARMVIEVNDYPGSGANNRHDPKSPGRP